MLKEHHFKGSAKIVWHLLVLSQSGNTLEQRVIVCLCFWIPNAVTFYPCHYSFFTASIFSIFFFILHVVSAVVSVLIRSFQYLTKTESHRFINLILLCMSVRNFMADVFFCLGYQRLWYKIIVINLLVYFK